MYTGDMARSEYIMSDQFEDCLAPDDNGSPELQLGDVLVYRDLNKGDGHTVMVIDPEERIAWGSHGWDGNPKFMDQSTSEYPAADLGVEFQKIKIKKDWDRWDRSSMDLVACWRHKEFSEDAKSPQGRPGLGAICEAAISPNSDYFEYSVCNNLEK